MSHSRARARERETSDSPYRTNRAGVGMTAPPVARCAARRPSGRARLLGEHRAERPGPARRRRAAR
jgi:hypothetical protein